MTNHKALPERCTKLARTNLGHEDDHDEGPGLWVSPPFWIGGALSIALWALFFWTLFA